MTFDEFLLGVVNDCINGPAEEWQSCIARDEPERNRCLACLDGEPERCEDVENAQR